MSSRRIAILGAGPAGLGAAWQLARQGKAEAAVLEQKPTVGGNAGSFRLAGITVDYGSHRLHPQCQPNILEDLKELLGADLLDRPRHGRIRLQNRWIHFPLKPQDLILRLPARFGAGVTMDAFKKIARRPGRNGDGHETFTKVLEKGLGATICRDFYFPYAEKIWGLPPEELSAAQAHRRVSAGSLGKMARKVLSVVPGLKTPGAGRFFYPRRGFGQISEAIFERARDLGADIRLNSAVEKIQLGSPHLITFDREGRRETIEADYVWSTIPVTILSKITAPAAPPEVIEASRKISYRAMVLIYLVLDQPQFTEFDAHYFPEAEIKLTRLSEPKNYGAVDLPPNKTVLCGELPCTVNDEIWNAPDRELKEIVIDALARCGLPVKANVSEALTKRLPFAYPIYTRDYETHFRLLDEWAGSLERVLTFGRQGLFAHDNTHHALAMAYAAVDCLNEKGDFDNARWLKYRSEFATHVVED